MAITVPVSVANTNTSATSISVSTSGLTGLQVGELMIAAFSYNTIGATITTPAGWTQIIKTEGAAFNVTSQLSYKFADASDVSGQSPNWSKGAGAQVLSIRLYRISGTRKVSAITASSGAATPTTVTHTTGTTTPTEPNSLVMLFIADVANAATHSGYALATSSPSFTEVNDENIGSGLSVASAYAIRPETTATGTGTVISSVSDGAVVQMLIVSAPQSFTVGDAVSLTEHVKYGLSILVRDAITIAESAAASLVTAWRNAAKTVASWLNTDKS